MQTKEKDLITSTRHMADSDADLFEADFNESASYTSTTRRSTRSATRQTETGPGLMEALLNRGINPAPGLSAGQLQSLEQEVSPGTSAQVEPIPAVPGRKRTRKANNPNAPPGKRKTVTHSSPNADQSPTLASTLQLLTQSLQTIDARLRYIENEASASRSRAQNPGTPAPQVSDIVTPQFSLASAIPAASPGKPYIPAAANISARLRAKILQGKYVNLISLILPSPECEERIATGEHFTALIKNADPRLSKDLSIGEFLAAFGLFRETICSVFPERRKELDDYLPIIGDLHLRYGRNVFYKYHKSFANKAALYVAQFNIRLNWASLDAELLVLTVGGTQPVSCFTCGVPGHSAGLCPTIPFRPPERETKTDLRPDHGSNFLDPGPEERVDSRGRKVLKINNQPVCNNFNESVCTYHSCAFLHVCSYCQDAHPKSACPRRVRPQQKSRGSKNF
ncbi:hypothetical protein EYF80_055417 [Liparis tanakae]|uniref:Cleavage and polyadenylation specificity factor subunit 4 n=1 Tax=Liparis tanakae TaxID=230148 RepID=A0A4Z2F0Y0_9TELE|nr:hypothetical protein EYF80_055417 [Liparis tanakae]